MKTKLLIIANIVFTPLISANILNINSIESNFEQTITNDQSSQIRYTGKMYAKQANNKALWQYKTPIKKQIFYTNGKLIIIEPELEQAIFAKLDKVPNVLALIKNAQKISNNTLSTTFNSITYTIQINGNKIDSISYTDELHNNVIIRFLNEKTNSYINDSKFVFNIPKNYDILEQK